MQFVPIDRTNPPAGVRQTAPPQVQAILERSCYDCHSNQTVWPWYSHVAPASWLIARDVHEGREHLNFTAWNRMNPEHLGHVWDEMREQITSGDMPLNYYLPLHPKARLSDEDKALIVAWTRQQEAAGKDGGAGNFSH
jgi:hypothetical protein